MGFYIESAKQMINPMNVPTFMIECAETERKLFEGLIELDFAEVYCESGLAVFTEEEKADAQKAGEEGSKKSIKTIVDNFVSALKAAFNSAKERLGKIFDSITDKVTKGILDSDKLKDAKVAQIEILWYEDYHKKAIESLKSVDDVLTNISSQIAKGEDFTDKLGAAYKEISEKVAEIPTKLEEAKAKDASLVSKIGDHDVKTLVKALSPAGIGRDLDEVYNNLKKVDLTHFAVSDNNSDHENDRNAKVLSQVFKVKLAYFAARAKIAMTTANIAMKNLGTLRGIVKGADKGETAEKTQESVAIYNALVDIFCESIYEF